MAVTYAQELQNDPNIPRLNAVWIKHASAEQDRSASYASNNAQKDQNEALDHPDFKPLPLEQRLINQIEKAYEKRDIHAVANLIALGMNEGREELQEELLSRAQDILSELSQSGAKRRNAGGRYAGAYFDE